MSSDSTLSATSVHMASVASATVRGVYADLFIMKWVIASSTIILHCSVVRSGMGDAAVCDTRLY